MKNLLASLKKIQLRQLLTVFLAGVVLLVSAACSSNTPTVGTAGYANDSAMKGLPGRVEPDVSESARIKTVPKTGMNSYSDVDPRTATKDAEKEAEALIESSERNIVNQSGDVKENTQRVLNKQTENLGQAGENIKQGVRSIGNQAQDATTQAQRATARLGNDAKKNVERAGDEAERTADRLGNQTERTASRIGSQAEDTKAEAQDQGGGIVKSIQRAAEDASDFVQNKTNEAAKGTQRTLEDAGDTLGGNRA